MEKSLKQKLLPLILLFVVVILDQITKALVVKFIPVNTIGASFMGGFFRIVHARNLGVAFSIGSMWPDWIRRIVFSLMPIIVLCLVLVFYFKNKDFTQVQRWAITGIVGGGFGNIIDRLFRPLGVVDFLDVQWFGLENSKISLLQMERWPTFNVADSAVVVCGILLVVSMIIAFGKEAKEIREANKDK